MAQPEIVSRQISFLHNGRPEGFVVHHPGIQGAFVRTDSI